MQLRSLDETCPPPMKLSDEGRDTYRELAMPFWIRWSRYSYSQDRAYQESLELEVIVHGGEA